MVLVVLVPKELFAMEKVGVSAPTETPLHKHALEHMPRETPEKQSNMTYSWPQIK